MHPTPKCIKFGGVYFAWELVKTEEVDNKMWNILTAPFMHMSGGAASMFWGQLKLRSYLVY